MRISWFMMSNSSVKSTNTNKANNLLSIVESTSFENVFSALKVIQLGLKRYWDGLNIFFIFKVVNKVGLVQSLKYFRKHYDFHHLVGQIYEF